MLDEAVHYASALTREKGEARWVAWRVCVQRARARAAIRALQGNDVVHIFRECSSRGANVSDSLYVIGSTERGIGVVLVIQRSHLLGVSSMAKKAKKKAAKKVAKKVTKKKVAKKKAAKKKTASASTGM